MRLNAGDTLGRYRIEKEVGRGGMATVYRAYQPSLQRFVAIKVLPDFFAEDLAFRERFSREAATVAQLRHPNIVTVFDYGEENGTPYIVTEFVAGETLASRLRRPASLEESLAILRPLAAALHYAHEHGVVHRDVKPSNVIIATDGTPVLTDFGLARIMGSMPRLTRTGTPLGTPEYMAPELAAGDVATPAVDRYALAVVAYEMLTGVVPYTAETPLAVLLAHLSKPVPRPSLVNPALSQEVEEALVRALEKDPDDRYATALEFAEALEAAAGKAAAPDRPPAGSRPEHTVRSPAPPPADPRPPSGGLAAPPAGDGGEAERSRAPAAEGERRATAPPRRGPRTEAALDAMEHPVTLLPLGVTALALTYLVLLSPVLGNGLLAGLLALGAGSLAAAGLVLRYPREYANAEERLGLTRLHGTLYAGFLAVNSAPGLETLTQLSRGYEQLQPALSRRDTDPLSIALVPALARETYRRGLSVLVDALELVNAVHTSGAERLRREVAAMEQEIPALGSDPRNAERLQMRKDRLESHEKRLRDIDEKQLKSDQLLFEAERCEAALHGTRMDLAAIRTGSTESSVDSVIQTLQRTIDQAKAVQAEIRRLGY